MTTVYLPRQGARPGLVCPRCWHRHRTWLAVAKCRWPSHQWIAGRPPVDGPCYASVSHCPHYRGGHLTAMLFATLAKAEAAKKLVDLTRCGGQCRGDHEVVRLDLTQGASDEQEDRDDGVSSD